MKIGILQTGHLPDALQSEFPDYPTMFQNLLAGQGFDFETYPVLEMVLPGSIHAADGWLITGSRHGAYEDHPCVLYCPFDFFSFDYFFLYLLL